MAVFPPALCRFWIFRNFFEEQELYYGESTFASIASTLADPLKRWWGVNQHYFWATISSASNKWTEYSNSMQTYYIKRSTPISFVIGRLLEYGTWCWSRRLRSPKVLNNQNLARRMLVWGGYACLWREVNSTLLHAGCGHINPGSFRSSPAAHESCKGGYPHLATGVQQGSCAWSAELPEAWEMPATKFKLRTSELNYIFRVPAEEGVAVTERLSPGLNRALWPERNSLRWCCKCALKTFQKAATDYRHLC